MTRNSYCSRCNRRSSTLSPFGLNGEELICSFCAEQARGLIMTEKHNRVKVKPLFAKTCPKCHNQFKTIHNCQVYCLEECKNAHHYERYKQRLNAKNILNPNLEGR